MAMVKMFDEGKESGKAKAGQGKVSPAQNEGTTSPPSLYLQHDHLKKLGLDKGKMPAVGTKIHVSGIAHVGSVSEDQDRGDGQKAPRRSMTLHMHQMEVGGEDEGEDVKEDRMKSGAKAEMDKALAREQPDEK